MDLVRPPRLRRGDTVATVSLSSGFASAVPHRYQAGRRQLEETFHLRVVEAPNSQRGEDFLYRNPQARADDLVWALTEPHVKGIVSNIGGDDSVRILPHVDHAVIREHPKVLLGFSDTTVQHVAFLNAGVISFYGPSVLAGIAENRGIHPYTADALRRALFTADPFGEIASAPEWTEHFLDWHEPAHQEIRRTHQPNPGPIWLQGMDGDPVEGHLAGGCLEVLEILKGTPWWPSMETWRGALLYFETSELVPAPHVVEAWLRNYAAQGILAAAAGLLLGRPYRYPMETKLKLFDTIRKVLAEAGRPDMPVVADMDFGHTSPTTVLPNGGRARLDPSRRSVSLVHPAVS